MKKKNLLNITSLSILLLGLDTGCNDTSKPVHEHVFKDVDTIEETCLNDGFLAHKECIYCGKYFVDNKEVSEKDIVIPKNEKKHVKTLIEEIPATCVATGIAAHYKCSVCDKLFANDKEVTNEDLVLAINPNNHKIVHYSQVDPKCVETGLKEHDECEYCHKIYVNNTQATLEDLIIPAIGTHDFTSNDVQCSNCDAYKISYEGQYHIIDNTNHIQFGNCLINGKISNSCSSKEKDKYFESIYANKNTFFTQSNKKALPIKNTGKEWTISNASTGTFTRFNYGVNDATYVGKFILSFDIKVDSDVEIQRFGAKIVDITGGVIDASNQPKLIGTNAGEENNKDRKFEPGVNYRFTYVFETTEAEQFIQIFAVPGAETNITISNLHTINLEGKENRIHGEMLYFGKATDSAIKNDDCNHEFKYNVDSKEAGCEVNGFINHEHCPVCGKNFVDGVENNNISQPATGHEYGELVLATASTCSEHGHSSYYQCAKCNKYFDENKNPLESLPELPLIEHTLGDWISNADEHYKECSVCHQQVLKGNHIPGPEATADTPQTCTECGYIIKEAIGHVHTAGELVNAVNPTCTSDGNVAYYECTICHHYFSDADCKNEIENIVLAGGHIMSELTPAKDATCTEDGNLAYYHCSRCNKFFEDQDGNNDITSSYLITKLGHKITLHDEVSSTCFTDGNLAYAYCEQCNKYFTNSDATSELSEHEIFGANNHNFVDGVCSDCGYNKLSFKTDSTYSFGSQGATMNPKLQENPGTWGLQSAKGLTTSSNETDGTLIANSSKVTNNSKRNAFLRYIPEVEGKTYIGNYYISFDITVESCTDSKIKEANLTLGFCIQGVGVSDNIASVDDKVTMLKIGTTYRFAANVSTKADNEFVQFNIRNLQKYGVKVVISNPTIKYVDNNPVTTTAISNKAFAVRVRKSV